MMQKHKVWNIIFGAIFVLGSWVLWWMTLGMIYDVADVSWWVLFFVATIVFLGFGLFLITARNLWYITLALCLAFLGGAVQDFSVLSIVVTLFSTLLVVAAAARIRDDIRSRTELHLSRSFRHGFGFLVIAMSFFVTALYFWHAIELPASDLLPRLELGQRTNSLVLRSLASVNPEFKALENDHITVDAFLQEVYKNQAEVSELSMPNINRLPDTEELSEEELQEIEREAERQVIAQQNAVQQDMLEKNREQFSDIAGIPLSGTEQVSDVLAGIINTKIRSFVIPQGADVSDSSMLLASVLALLLFLTIVSVTMLLRFIWFPLLPLTLWGCKKVGWIVVRKETREVEVIER